MLPYKFPVTSGNVSRFFMLFTLLLLLATGFMGYHSVNAWLTAKQDVMTDITHSMQKRIDAYRFATWQLYENLATSATGSPASTLQETRLRPDVYYLEKNRRKTEALIFGSHDSTTLEMTQRMSDYLDTLWGAESSTWSMYFLNGQDNSLILISTLPLKEMTAQAKDGAISNIVEARRAEMLQQANALDERESFSPLRRFSWQNAPYFTLRTTFNQPGHLATVVAFDLPVDDIIPPAMPLENFQLRQDMTPVAEGSDDPASDTHTRISWVNPFIEITAPLASTSLQLVYRIPVTQLALDTLRNLLWPLLANLALLLMSVAGLLMLRQQSLRPSENQSAELDALRLLNEEIVATLPVGLLVYDFANNRTLISNKIAEHLLPHLNLQKIINMSDQHQGVLQVTVNNEVYEIRHLRSMISPHTQLFMMRDQDRELLVNKKLQRAQQVLDKNHQTRQQLLQNLGFALQRPLQLLVADLQASGGPESATLLQATESARALSQLVEDIVLLNQLETLDWAPTPGPFSPRALLDELATAILPAMQRKGLTLLVESKPDADRLRYGDHKAIRKILATLLNYAVTTTAWGRVTLSLLTPDGRPDTLMFEIVDTGNGLRGEEIDNADFPFLGETQSDRFGQASGMAFFLCKQLCRQLGGQFDVQATPQIGSRYRIQLPLPPADAPEQEEGLLEGVNVLIDITVDDVRKIVISQLEAWGANCITSDERFSGQDHDVLVTDDPLRLTRWSLLLAGDEPGFTPLDEGQFRVNFNISSAMQDALLLLIEQQLAAEEQAGDEGQQPDIAQLVASGYFQLFVDTVPDDVIRLYNESANRDYSALAQTAHRLKGVFAMLNLLPGKQLCETLEQHIEHCDDSNIKKTTSEVDDYVNDLLQQGNQ